MTERHCSLRWDESALRKWLNNEFLEKAFNDVEKKLIEDVKKVRSDFSIIYGN